MKNKKVIERIFFIFIGMLLAMGLNVLADACTTTLSSTEITYGSTDVKSALDELYAVNTGTAGASQVLTGYTFSNDSDIGVAGTMTNNGAVSESVGVGGTYTIPAGYHNGSGTVTGPTLSGNAGAANVLKDKTFYSDSGTKQTGTMANNGAWSKSVSSTTAQTGGAGYYSSVSCAKAANTGTFTTSTNSTAVDMGANQNYRYVNTTGVYNAGKSAGAASWVQVWSGNTTGNISVSLSSYKYVVIRNNGGSWLILQVGGSEGCTARHGTSPDSMWGNWMGGRCYKATTGGISATTGTMAGIEDKGASWISITNVWGLKNLN